MKILNLFYIHFLLIIYSACTNNHHTNVIVPLNDSAIIANLTYNWNNSLTKHHLMDLDSLYADGILLYGTNVSKQQVIANKVAFITKYKDFKQSIISDLKIYKLDETKYKVQFQKQSEFNQQSSTVSAYLLFEKVDNKWKITQESDEITDKNINNMVNKENKEFNPCVEIVIELLKSSPTYTKATKGLYEAVVKNGGMSFGLTLEASPNPKEDKCYEFSESYELSLHENYSDHMPTIARYSFNPQKQQLYEYDIANNTLNPIEFDKSLLTKFQTICK